MEDVGGQCCALGNALGDLKHEPERAQDLIRAAWPALTKHERHVIARNVAEYVGHWDDFSKRMRQSYDSYAWNVLLHWVWDHQ